MTFDEKERELLLRCVGTTLSLVKNTSMIRDFFVPDHDFCDKLLKLYEKLEKGVVG